MSWLTLLTLLSLAEATPDATPTAERARYTPLLYVELAVTSSYVWRGAPVYSSSSTPSCQPHIWLDLPDLGPGTLTFDVWTAFAMSRREYTNAPDAASEVDLSLVYDLSLLRGWLELGAGFIYYIYPHSEEADGEKEVMVRLGVGNLPVSISLTAWTEVHPGLGVYLEPSVGWEQEVRSITVGVDIALGASISRDEEATLDHVTVTAGLTHTVGRLSLWLNLSYGLRLAPGLGDFLDRSLLHGALGISIAATEPPDPPLATSDHGRGSVEGSTEQP